MRHTRASRAPIRSAPWPVIALGLSLALAPAADAWADDADMDPAAAAEPAPITDHGSAALPGMHRVRTGEPVRGVLVFAGAGYGQTGEVFDLGDSHQRIAGAVAVAAGVTEWLALGVRFDGRYDSHDVVDTGESDDGWVGDPRLGVQISRALGESLRVGGELVLWFPGSDAPSVVAGAISGDLLGTVTYRAMGGRLALAANLGLRLDRSAAAVPDPTLLSRSDRLSLGVADANAALIGLGASLRLGRAALFAEWTLDKLFGDRAPSPDTSPMRLAAGLGLALSDAMAARVLVETNLATMPQALPDDPLAPFDPRLAVMAGVSYRFGGRPRSDGPLITDATDPEPVPDPQASAPAVVAGRVRAEDGSGVAGARVEVTSGEETRSATTDADGNYRVEDVPPGKVTVTITAPGFEPRTRELDLAGGASQALDSDLDKALPKGQLRGQVRAFSGAGLQAQVRIEPGDIDTTTDQDGAFEVDVPPGDYTVIIEAKGFRGQRRQVSVQENGVTIIQVDMRKK